MSAVFPLPAEAARPLAAAAGPLRREGHLVYPAAAIHLTLLNLDPWPHGADLAARVERALRGEGPVQVLLSGLAASRTGVYARAFSPDGSLRAARRALRAGLGRRLPGERGHEPALAHLPVGFVNVARFSTPPGKEVAAALRAARGLKLDPLTLHALELLSMDRVRSLEHTLVLARVAL